MAASEHDSSVRPEPQASAPGPADAWTDGAAYERYVGRWSRQVAHEFLAWLAVAPSARWLDVGCGTGALSQSILQHANPASVQGIDRAEGYVAFAREHVPDTRAQFAVQELQALAAASATYDAVVSGLVLNFLPQPAIALGHMIGATCAGGLVAAYVWDYAGNMQLMRHFWDAAVALNPQAAALDEGRRFPLCDPQALAELFHTVGLGAVEVRAIDIATNFQDFEDYWSPFLGGQGPAPSYVQALSDQQRAVLRERLRQSLPAQLDGSIPLVARAWAVRGVR
ncbi:MAG TPA: methyltransferase domain-containing protein [Roseiflexaceae bacterium]|nr:methyltransferase domain-containing protein [Roseiflexaceae bacterium]